MKHIPKNQRGELIIKQGTEDELLQVLLKEYELTLNRIDSIDNRLFQVMAAIVTILTVIIGYMIIQGPDFNKVGLALLTSWLAGAWLAPFFCLLAYTILIFQAHLQLAAVLNARTLSLRINNILGESALLYAEPKTIAGRFFSTRSGSTRIMILYVILYGGLVLFYPVLISLAYAIIYQYQSHFAATLFIALYAFLGFLIGFTALGVINELPQTYDEFLKSFDGSQQIPYFTKRPRSAVRTAQAMLALVLPRPADIIAKGPFFVYGFVAASIITGLNAWHLHLSNVLFGEVSTSWKNISALCLVYFIVEEILLQQAKLIWDDIRDHRRDKDLPRNKRRAIASGQMSISSAKLQLIVRLLAAFILGAILGGFALLGVFLLICLHQIIYVLWAKPRSARDPDSKREQRELLFFLSFNVSLRFLAGVVSVAGVNWALSPYILFYVLFYFCSFGALAAFWKMEAKYYEKDRGQFRSQSQYYLYNGRFWQYVGLLAAVLVGICMVVMQGLALACIPVIASFSGGCTLKSGGFQYVDYGLLGIPLVLILIALFGIISWGLVHLFRSIGNTIATLVGKAKPIFAPLFFIGAVVALLLLPFTHWNSVFLLFLSFLLLNIGYFFMYEGMTYEEYTMADFWKRLPNIKKAAGYFLFEPDKNIGLGRFITVATSDTDPNTWENKKACEEQ